jgi:hypothetical protein
MFLYTKANPDYTAKPGADGIEEESRERLQLSHECGLKELNRPPQHIAAGFGTKRYLVRRAFIVVTAYTLAHCQSHPLILACLVDVGLIVSSHTLHDG